MSQPIHQEITFAATPTKVYDALIRTEEHSRFTGSPASLSPDDGGAFSCYGGQILGRQIELIPGERIVQAWRVAAWDAGVYSLVRIELSAEGEGTRLVLDHSGVGEDFVEHIDAGWHERYWKPLRAFLEA